MEKKRKEFMKRFAAVFLSAILVVGMFTEMNLTDVRASSDVVVGTLTATVTVTIEGWDGVSDPGKTNFEPHLWFCPDFSASNHLEDGRSVEVTGYANNVTRSIEGNKIIYTYTWPSDISYIGNNTVIAATFNSLDKSSPSSHEGLADIAAAPWLNSNYPFSTRAYLYRFMDGDRQVGAFYWYSGDTQQYIELPETPVKDNYTFKGWVKEDGTPLRVDDISLYYFSINTYPMNFYATWEATGHSHNWDTDWEKNEDAHWHDCTAADCPVTDHSQKDGYGAHSWDTGTVTKEPTESETGKRLYRCTVCGYERTEVIPVKDPGHVHDYGTEWKADDAGHWHECSCGDKTDLAPHREGNGIIIKEPTETETGIKSYPCIDCGHVIRTETIPVKEGGGVSGNNPGDNGGDDSGNTGSGNSGNSVPGQADLVISAAGADKTGGTLGSEPKTGDAPRIEIYATIAMISGLLYLYLGGMERGMTEKEKKELVSRLIGWAKRGGSFRRGTALVVIFFVLLYYHSIGKRRSVNVKELCGE